MERGNPVPSGRSGTTRLSKSAGACRTHGTRGTPTNLDIMDNFGRRFCMACKRLAATTALGACALCGALTGVPVSSAAPTAHFTFTDNRPTPGLSTVYRDYRELENDYHYDGTYELTNIENVPVMGTAAVSHRPWPFPHPPWEPPALD